MATETLVPDTIVEINGLSGAVGDIDNTIASADGVWLTTQSQSSSFVRVTFPTPSGNPNTGANLQKFRVQIRKNSSGGNDPGVDLLLFENGTQISVVSSHTLTNATSEIFEGTWDASSLTNADGSGVELRISQTGGDTGNPNNRRYMEIDEVEWVADVSAGATPQSISTTAGSSVSFSPVPTYSQTISATGTGTASFTKKISKSLLMIGTASVSFLKQIFKSLSFSATGNPSVSPLATYQETISTTSPVQATVSPMSIFSVVINATAGSTVSFLKKISKSLVMIGISSVSYSKKVFKTISSTTTGVANLTATGLHFRTISATATAVVNFAQEVIENISESRAVFKYYLYRKTKGLRRRFPWRRKE